MDAPCRIVVGIDGARHSRDAIGFNMPLLRGGKPLAARVAVPPFPAREPRGGELGIRRWR